MIIYKLVVGREKGTGLGVSRYFLREGKRCRASTRSLNDISAEEEILIWMWGLVVHSRYSTSIYHTSTYLSFLDPTPENVNVSSRLQYAPVIDLYMPFRIRIPIITSYLTGCYFPTLLICSLQNSSQFCWFASFRAPPGLHGELGFVEDVD